MICRLTQTTQHRRWSVDRLWCIWCVLCCWISVSRFYRSSFLKWHTCVEFLTVGNEQDASGVEEFEELKCSAIMEVMVSRLYELVSKTDPMALTEDWKDDDEMLKTLQIGMRFNLDGLCTCQDERYELNTSRNSCWKLFPVWESGISDALERNAMYSVGHGTVISQPPIQRLVCHKEVGSAKMQLERIWKGRWGFWKIIMISWVDWWSPGEILKDGQTGIDIKSFTSFACFFPFQSQLFFEKSERLAVAHFCRWVLCVYSSHSVCNSHLWISKLLKIWKSVLQSVLVLHCFTLNRVGILEKTKRLCVLKEVGCKRAPCCFRRLRQNLQELGCHWGFKW